VEGSVIFTSNFNVTSAFGGGDRGGYGASNLSSIWRDAPEIKLPFKWTQDFVAGRDDMTSDVF
jgi:hypothetical protein